MNDESSKSPLDSDIEISSIRIMTNSPIDKEMNIETLKRTRRRKRRRRWKSEDLDLISQQVIGNELQQLSDSDDNSDDIVNIVPIVPYSINPSSSSTKCDIEYFNDNLIIDYNTNIVQLVHHPYPHYHNFRCNIAPPTNLISTNQPIDIENKMGDDFGLELTPPTDAFVNEYLPFSTNTTVSAIYVFTTIFSTIYQIFSFSMFFIVNFFLSCFSYIGNNGLRLQEHPNGRKRRRSIQSISYRPLTSLRFLSSSSSSLFSTVSHTILFINRHLMLMVLCLLTIESSLSYLSSTILSSSSSSSTLQNNKPGFSFGRIILDNLDSDIFFFNSLNRHNRHDQRQSTSDYYHYDVDYESEQLYNNNLLQPSPSSSYRSILGIFVGASKNYGLLLDARRHQSYYATTTTSIPFFPTTMASAGASFQRHPTSKPVYSSYLRTSNWHPHSHSHPNSQLSHTDLLAADSISLETYQQELQNQTHADGANTHTNNQTMAKLKASVRSYPIGESNQQFCDYILVPPPPPSGGDNYGELDSGSSDLLLDTDTIIQQRVIIESEQLELFLHLRPDRPMVLSNGRSRNNGTMDGNNEDNVMDESELDVGLEDSPGWESPDSLTNSEIDRLQCMQMLKLQLESGGKRRPLFELATGTFNVSCYVVPGPQFQCALFSYNMHHYASIFRGHKEPYCSSTFVRFNLLDTRCRLNLVLKRINPFKTNSEPDLDHSSSSASNQRSQGRRRTKPSSSSRSLPPLPITSSIWDTFQESIPLMSGPSGSHYSSSQSSDSPDSCATMCQKMYNEPTNGAKHTFSVRRRFNPNEMIFIENVRPKCLLQFDQSSIRSKLRSSVRFNNHFGQNNNNHHHQSGSISNRNDLSSMASPSLMQGGTSQDSQGSDGSGPSNDITKKTCIESSRHILTHNGLVIQHPTLKIVPVLGPPPSIGGDTSSNGTHPLLGNIVAGQTLPPLEFVLQLESKNLSSNAQYFDLVLKKYKWTGTISLLYPDIYPGVLTGQTSVPVQSVHYRSKEYENSYFRFTFNNLKVTKWGYRYLLKISLRSNPACYTIETTYGPFDVQFRTRTNVASKTSTTTPSVDNSTEPAPSDNSIRFVWTSQKCHSLRIELQASVVIDRGSSGHQVWMPPGGSSTSGKNYQPQQQQQMQQSSIPISRTVDYLCELNLEKLGTFLINFLSNRAVNNAGELLPSQLRRLSKQQQNNSQQQQQYRVHRNFHIDNEHSYVTFVDNFIRHQKLAINGTQCLEMIFRSKNVSLIATPTDGTPSHASASSNNQSDQISQIFNTRFNQFKSYHRQLLLQRLINMTFIYSSELLLKIKQIYLDDSPLHQPPPPPPTPPPPPPKTTTAPSIKSLKVLKKPPSIADDQQRNVEKRRTVHTNGKRNTTSILKEDSEDDHNNNDDNRTIDTTVNPRKSKSNNQSFKSTYPQVVFGSRGSSPAVARERSTITSSSSTSSTSTKRPKNRKNKSKKDGDTNGDDSDTNEINVNSIVQEKSSSGSLLSGRPLLWILILFANTLLVFAFVITFAVCYYRKMFADSTDPSRNKPLAVPNARKPLRPFPSSQSGPKSGPMSMSSAHHHRHHNGQAGDDVFMLEKTDYSSASSDDPYSYPSSASRQQFQQPSSQHQNGNNNQNHLGRQPGLRQSIAKVQNVQRVGRKLRNPDYEDGELMMGGAYHQDTTYGGQQESRSPGATEGVGGEDQAGIPPKEEDEDAESKENSKATPGSPVIEEAEDVDEEEEEIDEEEEAQDEWLPLPGSTDHLSRTPSPRKGSTSLLRPPSPMSMQTDGGGDDQLSTSPTFLGQRRLSSFERDLESEYSLKGDENEDQKYYIYKVRDINNVPKKECVGKVLIPASNRRRRSSQEPNDAIDNQGIVAKPNPKRQPVTLEQLRQLIRQSSDESLQDAAKQRFRYLSETYHLVAMDEAFTPVDSIYPTKGVFIKLDSEHPFSKKRVDKPSYTAKLQVEYERKFGPMKPRAKVSPLSMQPPKPRAPWELTDQELTAKDSKQQPTFNPALFVDEAYEAKQRRRPVINSIYKSIDYVEGKYQDSRTSNRERTINSRLSPIPASPPPPPVSSVPFYQDEADGWNPKQPQRKKGQRPPWRF